MIHGILLRFHYVISFLVLLGLLVPPSDEQKSTAISPALSFCFRNQLRCPWHREPQYFREAGQLQYCYWSITSPYPLNRGSISFSVLSHPQLVHGLRAYT
jgi:hypothetical protein